MRVIITAGAGFIGTAGLGRLPARSGHATGVDNLDR
jgi:nucleoside-diphosphate-sugar epimerase